MNYHEREFSGIYVEILDLSNLIDTLNKQLKTETCPLYPYNQDIEELIPDAPWGLLTARTSFVPFNGGEQDDCCNDEENCCNSEYTPTISYVDEFGGITDEGDSFHSSPENTKNTKSENANEMSIFAINHEGLFTQTPLNNTYQFLKVQFYPKFTDGSTGFEPVMFYQFNLDQVKNLPIACKTDLSVFLKRSSLRSNNFYNFIRTFYKGLQGGSLRSPLGNNDEVGPRIDKAEQIRRLEKYGNWLINHECSCSEFINLISVYDNGICPCGYINKHSHCKKCGGLRPAELLT